MQKEISVLGSPKYSISDTGTEFHIRFLESVRDSCVTITFSFPPEREDYIFMPACCYAGNQFRVLHKA